MEGNFKNFENIEKQIDSIDELPESAKSLLKKNFKKLKEQKMNIMITGATGAGKSSTINAIFNTEKAVVGTSSNPETMDIKCYKLDNLVIWDTPGTGDGADADKRHIRNIVNKLHEKDNQGNLLIDPVLVILDGGSRDLGTALDLINKVIIPNLGDKKEGRILVGINKCDMAKGGRHWDSAENKPKDDVLVSYMKEMEDTVKKRVYDSTGVKIEPVCYCAGYKEDRDKPQEPSFNINKLLFYIISKAPTEKRLITYIHADERRLNSDSQMEGEKNWRQETKTTVKESILDTVMDVISAVGDVVYGLVKLSKRFGF